jgi:hypothetical protein
MAARVAACRVRRARAAFAFTEAAPQEIGRVHHGYLSIIRWGISTGGGAETQRIRRATSSAAARHSLAVPSALAVASVRPSGEKATA